MDFTFLLKEKVTVDKIKEVFMKAQENPIYKDILEVTEEPLVSSDVIGNPHSAVVDLGMTRIVDDNLVKIIAWYDNEWAYIVRLVEMVVEVGKKLKK